MASGAGQSINEFLRTVTTVISTIATAGLGLWLIRFLRLRWTQTEQTKAKQTERDLLVSTRLDEILRKREAEYDQDKQLWLDERGQMAAEIIHLRRVNQSQLIDMGEMRARIAVQWGEIERLATGYSPLGSMDRFDPVIIAGIDGVIAWANESASLFLKYQFDELIGLNVDEIVPDTYRKDHKQGMARASMMLEKGMVPSTGGAPPTINRVVVGRAKLRDGTEVPVDIMLAAFMVKGVTVCRAQFRRRFERPRSDDAIPVVPVDAAGPGSTRPTPVTILDPDSGPKAPPPADGWPKRRKGWK